MPNWNARIKKAADARGVSGTELANACNIMAASVSGWFSGETKTMEAGNALKACTHLKINMEWLLYGRLPSGLEYDSPKLARMAEQYIEPYDINSISVPLMNAAGSMGDGHEVPDEDLVIDVLRLSKTWIGRKLPAVTSPANLAFIHAIGDSMADTFTDGDILLVDTGIKHIKADAVYVLEAQQRLFIKRVRQRMDGDFEISSDNPNYKTVDVLKGNNQVEVSGRVIWVWNGQRL